MVLRLSGVLLIAVGLILSARAESPTTESHPTEQSGVPTAEPFTPKPESEHHEAEEETTEEEELPPFHRIWAHGEYLLWRIRDSRLPLLATTGPVASVVPGAAGFTGTTPLYGGTNESNNWRSGARGFLGGWFDAEERFGAEAGYFFLGSRDVGFNQAQSGGTGSAILARPFFNALATINDASLVAFPGLLGGALNITNASQMQGGEVNGVMSVLKNREYSLDALAGFRFVYLKEFLRIQENDQVKIGAPVFPGDLIGVEDYFGTTNKFYGGQVGFKASLRKDSWDINLVGKTAIGSMMEVVAIQGATVITPPTGSQSVSPAGLLALSSNSGLFHRNMFAVVPEVTVDVSYHITERIHATLGYSFMYLSKVARPGDQVDVTINTNLVPTSLGAGMAGGPTRPFFAFHGTDFYAQGGFVGLMFQY